MSYYFAFRIFINDTNKEGISSLFRSKKEEFFQNSVKDLIQKKRVTIISRGETHFLHKNKLSKDLYLWQIAKKRHIDKPIINKDKLEVVPDTLYPYVFAVISLKYQIALIEQDTGVFESSRVAANKLEKYFNEKLASYRLTVRLNEISDLNDIYYEMEQFDSISKIEMEFDPPNFFRGRKDIDKIVNDVHDATRFDKMKLIVFNSFEGLTVNTKKVSSFLGRLASGAGNYIVTGMKDGLKHVINSIKFQAKKRYDNIEEIKLEELEEDIVTLDNLNNEANE